MIPATHVSAIAAEQPILWLGMSGFAPQQRAVLEASLVTSPRSVPLARRRIRRCRRVVGERREGPHHARRQPQSCGRSADGACAEPQFDRRRSAGGICHAPGQPRTSSLGARSIPYPNPASTPYSLQFERWLWPVRAQFVLGAQIIQRGPELRHGIYHVSHSGNLLAVLDFLRGKAAISPRVHPVDLQEARWAKRPAGAADLPESFVHLTPGQLAWAYVRRTETRRAAGTLPHRDDLLPPCAGCPAALAARLAPDAAARALR